MTAVKIRANLVTLHSKREVCLCATVTFVGTNEAKIQNPETSKGLNSYLIQTPISRRIQLSRIP